MSEIQPAILEQLKNIYPFSDLTGKDLDLLVSYLEPCEAQKGKILYKPGQNAEAFFFILAGDVEILLPAKNQQQPLQILHPYDHFGEDALVPSQKRLTAAVAKTPVTLIKISQKNILRIENESSIIKAIFKMFSRTYRNSCRIPLRWRQPSETIYLFLRQHIFFLFVKLIPILIVSLAVFAGLLYIAFTNTQASTIWVVLACLALSLGALSAAWEILAWLNQYFILTRERILTQKLLIGIFESRLETPMNAILSVGLTQSFLGRILGYGSVTARAYTGNFTVAKIPDPDLAYAFMEHRRKSILSDQRRQEQASMHASLETRFFPERSPNPAPVAASATSTSANYYTDSFSDLLARFFVLRLEKDGMIIYHTHWWVLLKKLFLPTLFLILVIAAAFARYTDLFQQIGDTTVYILAIIASFIGWCWWFYQYVDWHNDVYIITSDQLVDVNRKPLGTEDRKSAPVKNIQTVEYKRNGIIGMALNFGTVSIQIGTEILTFDDVYNPSAVQIEIFNRFREFTEYSRRQEQKRMTDWLSTYDGVRNENKNGDGNQVRNG